MTPCTAILANRQRCDREAGHGGRHHWVDLDRKPEPRR